MVKLILLQVCLWCWYSVYPIAAFTVDAGYEGSKVFGAQANSIVVGAGWKF
jgi:hypothetical protein